MILESARPHEKMGRFADLRTGGVLRRWLNCKIAPGPSAQVSTPSAPATEKSTETSAIPTGGGSYG